ncbi:unnamed protein product [Polarella glacialis]|uniref:Uncharacterized protein n=1 Tax=Polarella glacialis TaxID=89957 RepID=A0A813JF19_POLGL|nr:unnamed protein product [Polarella glacialis]
MALHGCFAIIWPVRLKEIKAFTEANASCTIVRHLCVCTALSGRWLELEADMSGFQNVPRSVTAGSCSLDAAWCGFAAACLAVETAAVSAVGYASPEGSCSAARCTQTQVVATQASLGQALAGNLIPQRLPSDINLDCAGVDTWASNSLKRFGMSCIRHE